MIEKNRALLFSLFTLNGILISSETSYTFCIIFYEF